MKKYILLLVTLLLLGFNELKCQIIYTQADSILFNKYIEKFAEKRSLLINELVVETAKYFINTPYVAATLEGYETESLVINLREFDCTTFVENCLALSEVIKSDNHNFINFCQILASIRYRNYTSNDNDIVIDNYTDRLHYMSDWVYENQEKKRMNDITLQIGGRKEKKDINYMTSHPQFYKHLEANINGFKLIEKNINERNSYNIISKSEIIVSEKQINDGDIIIFATNIAGLDYSHIGIAYRKIDGTLSFIHASSSKKKVLIENQSLVNYCQNSNRCTGISVIRINYQ